MEPITDIPTDRTRELGEVLVELLGLVADILEQQAEILARLDRLENGGTGQ